MWVEGTLLVAVNVSRNRRCSQAERFMISSRYSYRFVGVVFKERFDGFADGHRLCFELAHSFAGLGVGVAA